MADWIKHRDGEFMPDSLLGGAPAARDMTKPTNPKDRVAISKLGLDLFPDTAVVYGALAMAEGDLKYGAYNYRPGGVMASVYVAACRRHVAKWWNGQDHDPSTQVHHLGNALACIAVLIDAIECDVLNDNRPPKVDLTALLDDCEKRVIALQQLFPDGPGRYTEKEHGDGNSCK